MYELIYMNFGMVGLVVATGVTVGGIVYLIRRLIRRLRG